MLRHLKLNVKLCMRITVLIILIWTAIIYRSSLQTVRIEKTPGIVYMLQWTASNTEPFSFMERGSETFVKRKCLVMNCFVTANKELLGDITNFDVLLFHVKEVIQGKIKYMPKQRNWRQNYVFASMESSGYYPVPSETYDGYFNVTWTYKLNSDINFGYFVIRRKHGEVIGPSEYIEWLTLEEMLPIDKTIEKKLANKTIAAAWFASNCNAHSKRQQVAKEIQSEMKQYGMTLDVYGLCGDKQCPRSSMGDCLKLIENKYYFYFVFENSFAEDYVTEKLLHALQHYAVPVVFGGANYTRFMPNGIYLDARVLGPKELVRQMFEIISAPDRYNAFFKWHNHYSYHDIMDSPDTDPFCKLCEYFNRVDLKNNSNEVNDLENWWNPKVAQWITNYK